MGIAQLVWKNVLQKEFGTVKASYTLCRRLPSGEIQPRIVSGI